MCLLAVGDPYYGVESLDYSGRVYIFTGQLQGSTYTLNLHTTLGRQTWLRGYSFVIAGKNLMLQSL